MADNPTSVLLGLRDVRGTLGSFFLSVGGDVIARDLPAVFTEEVLDEVGPRVARLTESFAADGEEVLFCRVRFAEHVLCLRPTAQGIVCAFATPDVHVPALRMGLGLAARRMADLLASAARPAPARPVGSSLSRRP